MAKIIRDDVDRFFEHGIDISSKTLYMGSTTYLEDGEESGTDFTMARQVIKGLHILKKLDGANITIIMNNLGGDEYSGMAIFDAIKDCEDHHVTIEVMGCAMSMGSIILQAADTRVMTPNSRFMMHYGSFGIYAEAKTAYRWVEENKKIDKWMIDLYIEKIREKKPKFLRKKVEEMCNFDTILSAKETLELGLIDKIKGE